MEEPTKKLQKIIYIIDKIWKLRYNQSEFGGSQFIVKDRSGCKKQEDVLNYSSLLQNS